VHANFPTWIIRGLYFVGIVSGAISLLGYFVAHRSWRVGFFVLSFLLLILLVLLLYFTINAFTSIKTTKTYYSTTNCLGRLDIVHEDEIQAVGCPAKYLSYDQCPESQRYYQWEGTSYDNSGYPTTTAASSFLDMDMTPFSESPDGLNDSLMNAQEGATTTTYYCLNQQCCGLNGQLYTRDLLILANFGLATIVAGVLVSVGCYYFWYVAWVDTARSRKKDFWWILFMLAEIVGILVALSSAKVPYIYELLDSSGNHQ